MSNEQNPVESQEDDLDAFSAEFFGQKTAPIEQASSEEKNEDDLDDSDATEEDTHSGEDDTPATDEDETDEDEEEVLEEEPASKPKKTRFQERIDELTAGKREAERKAADLEARLAKLEQNEKPKPESVKVEVDTGPTPDDLNEDGSDKYALGEFDPQYIRDLTRYTFKVERDAMKAEEAEEERKQEMSQQRAALQSTWEQKLGPAQERYPDFIDKGQALLSQFDNLDPAYGEYLTETLMSLENGHDVLYYLASNPAEAVTIVNSGAAKATIAFGRLDAKFVDDEEKPKARSKVSKAPTPPVHINKGSSVARADVAPDTDDLDAFASEFFAKKKRRG